MSTMTTGRCVIARGRTCWKKSNVRNRSSSSGGGSQMRSATRPIRRTRQITRAKPNCCPKRASLFIVRRPRPAGRAPCAPLSLLPERPHELVAERFHQVGDHGAVAGLHEGLDRHARCELDVAETRDLLCRHGYPDSVIGLASALVERGIGGDTANGA